MLDSVGIGELPDAHAYGDTGSHTLRACYRTGRLELPTLAALGLYNIDGIGIGEGAEAPKAAFARMAEASAGKDTTTGHWEMAGIISHKPMPTYPQGFPPKILEEFERRTGRRALCGLPYSGTKVLEEYGAQHLKTGALIVYTSADSVFQIAAHESVVPPEELYEYCRIARDFLQGEHGVGRVIARPFTGEYPNFTRTPRRHDFSLPPPAHTVLDEVSAAGLDCLAVGKISDIFAGRGITKALPTVSNADGMEKTQSLAHEDFHGLCFVNLVDFDMTYGHRNDAAGYTGALNGFDRWLCDFLPLLRADDLLVITADHGCDPSTPSTDHSREYVPMLAYGSRVRAGLNLGTRQTFSDLGATVAECLGVPLSTQGTSFWRDISEVPLNAKPFCNFSQF